MTKDDRKDGDLELRIIFGDRDKEEAEPQVTLIARDTKMNVIAASPAGRDGQVRVPAEALKEAASFALIPADADPKELEGVETVPFHRHQLEAAVAGSAVLEVGRHQWLRLIPFRRCIGGTVEHCRFWPWLRQLTNERVARSISLRQARSTRLQEAVSLRNDLAIEAQLIEPVLPAWFACRPVCDGIVEVYRRRCCCHPIIIYDPRIPEIVNWLDDIVTRLPPVLPPRPQPDPAPDFFIETPFMKDGTVDQIAINAEADLEALQTLPPAEVAEYLQARPYLWCFCTQQTKVAQGFVQPEGTFNICWYEPLTLIPINCHYEYAFVVKQLIDDQTVTIYNGVAAGQWFELGDEINLVSYHPGAVICDPGGGNIGTASVILDAIGVTSSTDLQTPFQTSRASVTPPSGQDGLQDPATPLPVPLPPALPPVQYDNYGWGGSLAHRYQFGPGLEPIATYYRVSWRQANFLGNPTGAEKSFNAPLTWEWRRLRTDGTIKREQVPLGPVAGTNDLYLIPYESLFTGSLLPGESGLWYFLQHHAHLDSTDEAEGRWLVTLELFDGGQNLIKPNAAPGGEPGIAQPFSYQRWDPADLSQSIEVPFGALTHLLWWDNRPTTAKIHNLSVGGSPTSDVCLFLSGPSNTELRVNYTAMHPENRFQLRHWMSWTRGISGGSGTFVPTNSGNPAPGLSPPQDYGTLLGAETKCAFSLNLHVEAKITNGYGTMSAYNSSDAAAFALEATS